MKKKKTNHFDETIPYYNDLIGFYKHIKASPPLSEHFDIREINPEVIKSYDYVAKPFRHNLYCITLYLEGDVTLTTGFWKTKLNKPALYFKTPHQLLSWIKPEKWLKEFFIVFTENFLLKYIKSSYKLVLSVSRKRFIPIPVLMLQSVLSSRFDARRQVRQHYHRENIHGIE